MEFGRFLDGFVQDSKTQAQPQQPQPPMQQTQHQQPQPQHQHQQPQPPMEQPQQLQHSGNQMPQLNNPLAMLFAQQQMATYAQNVHEVIRQTQMTEHYAKMSLDAAGGEVARALVLFEERKNTLPPQAFQFYHSQHHSQQASIPAVVPQKAAADDGFGNFASPPPAPVPPKQQPKDGRHACTPPQGTQAADEDDFGAFMQAAPALGSLVQGISESKPVPQDPTGQSFGSFMQPGFGPPPIPPAPGAPSPVKSPLEDDEFGDFTTSSATLPVPNASITHAEVHQPPVPATAGADCALHTTSAIGMSANSIAPCSAPSAGPVGGHSQPAPQQTPPALDVSKCNAHLPSVSASFMGSLTGETFGGSAPPIPPASAAGPVVNGGLGSFGKSGPPLESHGSHLNFAADVCGSSSVPVPSPVVQDEDFGDFAVSSSKRAATIDAPKCNAPPADDEFGDFTKPVPLQDTPALARPMQALGGSVKSDAPQLVSAGSHAEDEFGDFTQPAPSQGTPAVAASTPTLQGSALECSTKSDVPKLAPAGDFESVASAQALGGSVKSGAPQLVSAGSHAEDEFGDFTQSAPSQGTPALAASMRALGGSVRSDAPQCSHAEDDFGDFAQPASTPAKTNGPHLASVGHFGESAQPVPLEDAPMFAGSTPALEGTPSQNCEGSKMSDPTPLAGDGLWGSAQPALPKGASSGFTSVLKGSAGPEDEDFGDFTQAAGLLKAPLPPALPTDTAEDTFGDFEQSAAAQTAAEDTRIGKPTANSVDGEPSVPHVSAMDVDAFGRPIQTSETRSADTPPASSVHDDFAQFNTAVGFVQQDDPRLEACESDASQANTLPAAAVPADNDFGDFAQFEPQSTPAVNFDDLPKSGVPIRPDGADGNVASGNSQEAPSTETAAVPDSDPVGYGGLSQVPPAAPVNTSSCTEPSEAPSTSMPPRAPAEGSTRCMHPKVKTRRRGRPCEEAVKCAQRLAGCAEKALEVSLLLNGGSMAVADVSFSVGGLADPVKLAVQAGVPRNEIDQLTSTLSHLTLSLTEAIQAVDLPLAIDVNKQRLAWIFQQIALLKVKLPDRICFGLEALSRVERHLGLLLLRAGGTDPSAISRFCGDKQAARHLHELALMAAAALDGSDIVREGRVPAVLELGREVAAHFGVTKPHVADDDFFVECALSGVRMSSLELEKAVDLPQGKGMAYTPAFNLWRVVAM